MRALDERLSVLLRSIGYGVIETDMSGVIADINPAAESLTGWLDRSAVGENVKDVFKVLDDDGSLAESPVDRAISTGESVEVPKYMVLLSKEGKRLNVSDVVASVLSDSEGPSGVLLVFKDANRRHYDGTSEDFRRAFQGLMADLAFRFATLPSDDVESALDDALGRIALLFDVDHCSIFRSWRSGMVLFHQWSRKNSPVVDRCPPDECCCVSKGAPIAIADLSDDMRACPAGGLHSQGVRSVLCVPMRGKSSLSVGVVRFDSSYPRVWTRNTSPSPPRSWT